MLLALGSHQFDVTHRAIVMGIVDRHESGPDATVRHAETHLAAGADCLSLASWQIEEIEATERHGVVTAVRALGARFDVPVCVDTSRSGVACAAYEHGAAATRDERGAIDPALLRCARDAGASVVLVEPVRAGGLGATIGALEERARDARAAEIADERILVEITVGLDADEAHRLAVARNQDRVARLGWPLVHSTTGAASYDEIAADAVGIMQGVRILRTRDVRAARRVAAIGERLLGARDAAPHSRDPDPVA